MLSNQEHIKSCVKLSDLLDIQIKIAIRVPKTYIHPLFCILSTTTSASENQPLVIRQKSRFKLEKVVIMLKRISKRFLRA